MLPRTIPEMNEWSLEEVKVCVCVCLCVCILVFKWKKKKKQIARHPHSESLPPRTLAQGKKRHLCLLSLTVSNHFCLCHWTYLELTFIPTSYEALRLNALHLLQCIPFCFWADRPLNLIRGEKKWHVCVRASRQNDVIVSAAWFSA